MKKTLSIFLFAALLLLSACGSSTVIVPEATPEPTPEPTPEIFSGETENWPLTFHWQDVQWSGSFSGMVEADSPVQGTVLAENEAGQTLRFSGNLAEGAPYTGTLETDRLITSVEGLRVSGSYAGDIVAGLPEGNGSFSARGENNIPFTYTGSWYGGVMNGLGELRWAASDYLVRSGSFTDGYFTPNGIEALRSMGTGTPNYTLSPEMEEYLLNFPEIWDPENNHKNFLRSIYKDCYNSRLTADKILSAGDELEPQWFLVYSTRIISALAEPLWEGGPVYTRIVATNTNYTQAYYFIVPGDATGMRRGASMHVYGVPLGQGSYIAENGEQRSCIVALVGDLYYE